MEIKYFQVKQDGRTIKQNVDVKNDQEQSKEEKRKKLVNILTSTQGITLPIEIKVNGKDETHNFVFHLDSGSKDSDSKLKGGDLVISLPSGEEIGAISYIVLTKGKTSDKLTSFISDKGYHKSGKDLYGNKGVMKIAFSLLAEVLKEYGIEKIEAYIAGGLAAEKSRLNAPKIFGVGTYADSSEEVEIDSTERPGRKEKLLVTTL